MTNARITPDDWGCLLHREYHEFSEECALYAAKWLLGQDRSETRLQYAYEMELEARILRDTWKLAK